MKILSPELHRQADQVLLRARVQSGLGESWLHFGVPASEESALAPDTSDAFMIGLLPIAMALNEDIECEGPVSETLLFNVDAGYKKVLKAQIPRLNCVQVNAEGENSFVRHGSVVATGISGGLDSSHMIADYHLAANVPASLRVRQLLFFNVGSHGDRDQARSMEMYQKRLQKIRMAADYVGLPLITVDSNLATFYDAVDMSHQLTATARNVAAALAVQGRVRRYLVASGPTWERSAVKPFRTMETTDVFSLPLVRTERLDALSIGGHLTRGEKLERVVKYDFSRQFLMPCVRSAENCGACNKCMGVQLGLEILGVLPGYHQVFDPAVWQRVRPGFIAMVKRGIKGSHREMAEFAKSRGYRLETSLRARFKQRARELEEFMPEPVRNLRRGLARVG